MNVFAEIISALDIVANSALGWRYAVSRSYRKRVRERWRARGHRSAIGIIVWRISCFLVANALLFVALVYVYEGVIWLYGGVVAPRLR
jgi:hypothetical protein